MNDQITSYFLISNQIRVKYWISPTLFHHYVKHNVLNHKVLEERSKKKEKKKSKKKEREKRKFYRTGNLLLQDMILYSHFFSVWPVPGQRRHLCREEEQHQVQPLRLAIWQPARESTWQQNAELNILGSWLSACHTTYSEGSSGFQHFLHMQRSGLTENLSISV